MAWLSTAVSLGFVVGPALGGILSRRDLHFTARYGHLMVDSFSVPFFAAAALGLLTLFAAMRWLPESLAAHGPHAAGEKPETDWRKLARNLGPLLGLALIGQFGLAIFEATFALYAQAKFNYGPGEVGAAFVVCGLVMSVFQVGAVGFLAGRINEIYQIGAGCSGVPHQTPPSAIPQPRPLSPRAANLTLTSAVRGNQNLAGGSLASWQDGDWIFCGQSPGPARCHLYFLKISLMIFSATDFCDARNR